MYKDKRYWDMIRISNEDKEYPSKMGQKWTDEEEILLLEELNNNLDIGAIAQEHSRTIGGINSRRREIAYKMHLKNISTEEIINQTKLDYESIKQTIEKRQQMEKRQAMEKQTTGKIKNSQIDNVLISINKNDYVGLQNDVKIIKTDIKEIKNTIKELVEMMKAVYDFEDA
jgi:hypothetical protein